MYWNKKEGIFLNLLWYFFFIIIACYYMAESIYLKARRLLYKLKPNKE